MSAKVAISARNLSKMYLLYRKPQDRLKQSLFHRFGKDYARVFWALHDVSFDLERGKTLGIIGRNGSGKSTLLQIICGTLQPTSGTVSVNGRVTALLELGAGFNPEFTGRENIFLNGATLNIPLNEMRQRLDQIIDFAQIGEFIDQPVKIYSSGMYVRLAFAIATSVDPDVLVIDEALAVGDTGFVIKCMKRIKQLRENGSTILLVTHDVQTVRTFCDSALWLSEGRVMANGSTLDVTSGYIRSMFEDISSPVLETEPQDSVRMPNATSKMAHAIQLDERSDLIRWGSGELRFLQCAINSEQMPGETPVFEYGKALHIQVEARAIQDIDSDQIGFGLAFRNPKGLDIVTSTTLDRENRIHSLRAGDRIRVSFELDNILAPGEYALVLNIEDRTGGVPRYFDFIENTIIFRVVSPMHIFSAVLPPVTQSVAIIPA
jgi:ABC-type polysaccharide/polyol phosphate transport system ATPase subunit